MNLLRSVADIIAIGAITLGTILFLFTLFIGKRNWYYLVVSKCLLVCAVDEYLYADYPWCLLCVAISFMYYNYWRKHRKPANP